MREFRKDNLTVKIYENRLLMGEGAAVAVAKKINDLMEGNEYLNIVFAAAPSQNEFLEALKQKEINWRRINAFHMDEYVGLDGKAPQLFGNYLKEKILGKVVFHEIFYLNGNAQNMEEECKRYSELLIRYPTDIVLLGIGENTHIAFNDPHVADFKDSRLVKIVDLDEKNRLQQVDPGDPSCFVDLELVPTHAITLTVPALYKAKYAYAVVPGDRKSNAIYHTLNNEVQERYPSTILRKHPNAELYIDESSASELPE